MDIIQRIRAACTEENELLDASSIKMTDAPFGRTDSEDDIIEDYEDGISFKASCLRHRTALEKLLLLLLLLFLVIIIGLAVGLTRPKLLPVTKYCQSPPCVKAASSILSSVDWSVDPCQNFFQFACGHWLRKHPIPRGYHYWDRFQELSGNNLYMLSNLIESSSNTGSAANKTKTLFTSCMQATTEARKKVLQEFSSIIDEAGGWSLSQDTSLQWTLLSGLQAIHQRGAWPFFKVSVEVDERDPTNLYIIKIDVGDTGLKSDLLPYINNPNNLTINNTENAFKDAKEIARLFMNETIHFFKSFGASESMANSYAEEILELEKKITSASQGYHHIHDRFSLFNVMTVHDLEYNYTAISWSKYLNALGFAVDPKTEVVVLHPDYLTKISTILKEYNSPGSSIKSRTLKNYLAVSLIRSFKPYFDKSLFEIQENVEDAMDEKWKRCTYYTNKAMGFSTGAMYVKGTNSEGSVEKMQKLITYVKNAFKDVLLNKYWMDKVTLKRAAEKVDEIIDKISYPSYILNGTFLDSYYDDFQVIPGNWFSNLLSWRRFLLGKMNLNLGSKPDRRSWLRPPVTEHATYSPIRNDVMFPIAMFHLPFYIPDGPSAVNFGAMGSIIGHAITHAFDFQGRQYDGLGKLSNWWDENTAHNFLTTTKCMKDQYSNMKVRGVKLDGNFSLDENIADNGGLRAALFAYQMWINKYGDELDLPGLNLTMYQTFYTSYAQMYCSKYTDAGLFMHLLTDPHSPGSARINGVMQNSQTFSYAFNCPFDSPMNPRVRCEVW